MSGFFRPAAAKMSTTSSETTALETICRIAWSSSSSVLRSPGSALRQHGAHRLEEADVVADAQAPRRCGTASANACDSSVTARSSRALPSSCARMCSCAAGQQRQPLLRRARRPAAPVEAVEQAAADLVLLEHHGDGFGLVDRGLAGAAALRVGRERLLQLVGEAEVVDDQPAGLVLEHPVHARDRLHQPVPAHRLVDVHRVQARRVEAGQPHVAHDHDAGTGRRVAEPVRQRLAARLVADVLLPVERVGGRAGHHDLERAVVVVVARASPGRSATISS